MKNVHDIKSIRFKEDEIILKVDGFELKLPLAQLSKRLLKASQKEREFFEISPSGYGIHWPLIDEDLSIDGILKLAKGKRKQVMS